MEFTTHDPRTASAKHEAPLRWLPNTLIAAALLLGNVLLYGFSKGSPDDAGTVLAVYNLICGAVAFSFDRMTVVLFAIAGVFVSAMI